MSLRRNVAASIAAVALTSVTGLVCLGLLARQLGPADFGRVSLILLVFNFFIFFDGARAVVVKLWHRHPGERPGLLGTALVSAATVGIIAAAVCMAAADLVFAEFSLATTAVLGLAAGLHYPGAVFWGVLDAQERVGLTALVRAGLQAAVYLAFVALALAAQPMVVYAAALVVMNLLQLAIFATLALASGARPARPGVAVLREFLDGGLRMFAFNSFSAILTAWDRLVLARLMPVAVLGVYSLQVELGVRGRVLVNGFGRVLYPRLCRELVAAPEQVVFARYAAVFKAGFAALFVVCLAISTWSVPLLELYAGAEYASYPFVLQVVMGMLPVNALGIIAMVAQRAVLDFSTQPKAYGFAVVLGVLTVVPLVSAWGMVGALVVYCLMRSGDVLVAGALGRRLIRSRTTWAWIGLAGLLYAACWALQVSGAAGWSWAVAVAALAAMFQAGRPGTAFAAGQSHGGDPR